MTTATQPAGAATSFPTGARFDYQIGGAYTPPRNVVIVDRDRHVAPSAGHYNICYVNAFQAQAEATSWWKKYHPTLLLKDAAGHYVIDTDWNEYLFDISTPAKRTALMAIENGWIYGCRQAGYQAVEPDNLDSFTRSKGRLNASDAVTFAALLSSRAHEDGLLIAQKNLAEYADRRSVTHFDFAIAEECEVYRECGSYTANYGKRVIEIEYTDNGRTAFFRACQARGSAISIELVDRDVRPAGTLGHVRRWCG